MRRGSCWMTLLVMLMLPQICGAAVAQSPYPNPYRQTMWNSLTDKMHTLGQSSRQSQLTIRQLHQARTDTRLKDINRAKAKGWLHGH